MAADWKDIAENTKEKYGLYLASREWSVLKRQVHERAGGICERCNVNRIDAVHHLTYVRIYEEDLKDLQGICSGCHGFTHAKTDDDPLEDDAPEFHSLAVLYLQIPTEFGDRIRHTSEVKYMIQEGNEQNKECGVNFKLTIHEPGSKGASGIGMNDDQFSKFFENMVHVAAAWGSREVIARVKAICDDAAKHL